MLEYVASTNIILWADTYKFGHWAQIPPGVKRLVAAVVPRKALPFTDEIVAAGQTLIAHVFSVARVTAEMIDEAEIEVTQQGYDFNRAGWEYIVEHFDGRIPLSMFGVEEGRVIRAQTPMLNVSNEDERLAWLVPYFEPVIQSTCWSMTYTATICRYMYKTIEKYMVETGSDMSRLEYMVHYFGDRGADGPDETPVMKSLSHAMLFSGSDSARANRIIKKLYVTTKAYTSSVEATEHTTMCLNSDAAARDDFGAMEMVMKRFAQVVDRAKRGLGIPVMSAVIDTYDDERFVREYFKFFKSDIEASGGRLVARPDSGVPAEKSVSVLKWLEEIFGSSLTKTGHKSLPPCTGMLYGDGMNVHTFESVIKAIVSAGYSLDSALLGMGAGIANEGSRDAMSFSMKTISAFFDRWVRLLKEPKSDLGKKSLSGLVRCRENESGELEVFDALMDGSIYDFFKEAPGHRAWLDNGRRSWRQSFDSVRAFARS
jgi:nicotinamide phosphoribosyltransferase